MSAVTFIVRVHINKLINHEKTFDFFFFSYVKKYENKERNTLSIGPKIMKLIIFWKLAISFFLPIQHQNLKKKLKLKIKDKF